MLKAIFVTIMGIGGVYVGTRYAKWHSSHIGKNLHNRYPDSSCEMGDDTNDDE